MQNQFSKLPGLNPRTVSEEMKGNAPGQPFIDFKKTRLTGNAACDWHGICNNAGCPTIVDWQAI